MIRTVPLAIACAVVFAPHAHAQTAAVAPSPTVIEPTESVYNLGTVVVSGKQPGPKMWRVQKGEHTMWVLGTLSPLPSGLDWDSERVRERIRSSQEIIWQPGIAVGLKGNIFKNAWVLARLTTAGKNPDNKQLKDVLPPATYLRWVDFKARYVGNDKSIESMRPVFVATKLYESALKKRGMADSGKLFEPLKTEAKSQKIKITSPQVKAVISDAGKIVDLLKKTQFDDVACLEKTMDAIETDMPLIAGNAMAWSSGRIADIRTARLRDREETCMNAVMGTEILRLIGLSDVANKLRNEWTAQAAAALQRNTVSFAMLPVSNLQGANSFLKGLESLGYTVTAPSSN